MKHDDDRIRRLRLSIRRAEVSGVFDHCAARIARAITDPNTSPGQLRYLRQLGRHLLEEAESTLYMKRGLSVRRMSQLRQLCPGEARPADLVPSVTAECPPAPISDAEVAYFRDAIATEDNLREWIWYDPRGADLIVPPLIWLDNAVVAGALIAPRYRSGQIQRTWSEDAGWERNLIEDYIVLAATAYGQLEQDKLLGEVLKLRPYIRGCPNNAFLDAIRAARRKLVDREWLREAADLIAITGVGEHVGRSRIWPEWRRR